jgi:hypothetical protein
MRHFGKIIMGAALATLVACGDSTGPAVEDNNSGTGTTTLSVDARIDGQDAPGGFITDFIVTVLTGEGLPVSDATVTVQNSTLGTVTLLEVEVGSGVYRAERNSFPDGNFRLDVVSGDDKVENVVVGGIGIHEITAPLTQANFTAGEPITVEWDAPALARGVEIETRDYESPVLADNGSAVISGENNPERAEQRIRVYRFNEVDIVGGLPGSDFLLTIRNTVEPISVTPIPAQ